MRSLYHVVPAILLLTSLAAPPLAAQDNRPARGLSFWMTAPAGTLPDLASSAAGAPRFTIGARKDRWRYGLGIGITHLESVETTDFGGGATDKNTSSASAWQIGPDIVRDIWVSPDGRTRGTLGAGASYGRFSMTDRFESVFPGGSNVSETRTSGDLIGGRIALGGDHFFHPHFALGGEAGFTGTFGLDLKEEGPVGAPRTTRGLTAAGSYASLRVLVVF